MSDILSQTHIGLHVRARYSCQILMKLKFSRKIFENNQARNFRKIRPVGAEFYADGQTDMNLIVAFRNSAKAPPPKKRDYNALIHLG